MKRATLLAAVSVAVVTALLSAGCTPAAPPTGGTTSTTTTGTAGGTKGPIRVGSKIDVEGPVLGNIIIAMLEKNGFTVEDKTRTGATNVVRQALVSGQIDCYPEYTANGILVFHPEAKVAASVLQNAQQTYETAKSLDASVGIVWLQAAPANNTWGMSCTKTFSDANNIKTWEDFAKYVNAGKAVKVAGSQEFFTSKVAMPAFEKAYGFTLKSGQTVALGTGDPSVDEKAAAQGTNGINFAMAYGTDGTLSALNLVFLKDDKGVQPFYQPAPIFRKEIIDKYPEIPGILDPVFAKLDLTVLQKLNGEVAVQGQDPKAVATAWLTQEGLLK